LLALLERATVRFDDLDERRAVVAELFFLREEDAVDLEDFPDFVDFFVVLAKVSSRKIPITERSNSKAIRAADERASLFIMNVLVL
jgi:hypothetical protein